MKPLGFREREVKVSDLPSSTLRAPKTHTLSRPRPYSRDALMRWPSGDHPGAGGKARGVTGPSSSTQTTVEPGGGSVYKPTILDLLGRTPGPCSRPTAGCSANAPLHAAGCA